MEQRSTSKIDIAKYYVINKGFSIIPLNQMEKNPAIESWMEYQKRKPSIEEIESWFKDDSLNIGIVTGEVSGLSVVDCDSKEGWDYIESNGLGATPKVKTGRGYHYYFKYKTGMRNNIKVRPGIDIKSEGGYVVAPPSMHKSGVYYEWMSGHSLDDIPVAEMPKNIAVSPAIKSSTEVENIYKGVPEGGRNSALAKIVGQLINKEFSRTESLSFALAWNKENTPPMGLKEVATTVKSIYETHKRGNNPLLSDNAGHMIPKRIGNLLNEPDNETDWLLDGILPMKGLSILASKPKVGKSTLARNLAFCTARGETFFGRKVNKGPVIYYALEEKEDEVKRHFRDMGATVSDDIYTYSGGVTENAIHDISKTTNDIKPVLIIIDPLFRFAKLYDANDYIQATRALEPLLRFAREHDIHVLLIHHTNKKEKQDSDSLLGSTGIYASVDTLLIMKKDNDYRRTISSSQRYGEDLTDFVIIFDKNSRTVNLGQSKKEEELSTTENEILELLKTQLEAITEKEIEEKVKGKTEVFRKALRKLVYEGKVHKEGQGTKGAPFGYSCSLVPPIGGEQENEYLTWSEVEPEATVFQ